LLVAGSNRNAVLSQNPTPAQTFEIGAIRVNIVHGHSIPLNANALFGGG